MDRGLNDDDHGVAYDVVLWIEEAVMKGFVPVKLSVHFANLSARLKMDAGIAATNRLVIGMA